MASTNAEMFSVGPPHADIIGLPGLKYKVVKIQKYNFMINVTLSTNIFRYKIRNVKHNIDITL